MTTEYAFKTASDDGRVQVDTLAAILDGTSTQLLNELCPQPGWRCLELGAGNGSIARWIADRVGPTGSVDAIDIDTDHIEHAPGVTIHSHDINQGFPVDDRYDLIHTRLLLMHLHRRREIFEALVDRLTPDGWLVIGDVGPIVPTAVTGREDADIALFDHVLDIGLRLAAPSVGMDLGWAHEVSGHMRAAGLDRIHAAERRFTATGGSEGMLYYRSLVQQLEPVLQAHGLSEEDLWRFANIMLDPTFAAWSFQFTFTCGRRPAHR
ncbi:class I SAM-dependent methyltransferase [Gordonia sp. CPCC 206044]|uniref:class I SAM-dependent methyltransferase n=1 Tax=Gordonia sp. CPCC 206044 TaxID=3140793 RepID=UPI003AF36CC6